MRRLWISLGVLAGLIVLVVAAVFAIRSQLTPPARSGGGSCSPGPCVDAGGYRMDVTQVQRDGDVVRLHVWFQVKGRSNMHAEPVDFSLRQRGHTYHPYFDAAAGCPDWPRTQIPDGTSLGPLQAGEHQRPAHPQLGSRPGHLGVFLVRLRPDPVTSGVAGRH